MPYTSPEESIPLILKYLPALPHWPQLPKRSIKENMYIQFSEGFPGISLRENNLIVEQKEIFYDEIEQLINNYDNNDFHSYRVSSDYASGLYSFTDQQFPNALALKGQITGPLSWGLCVKDTRGIPIIYDDLFGELIGKFLKLKASWQENLLKEVLPETIIFIDEPYLSSIGSVFITLPQDTIKSLMEEVLSGIKGFKGVHCCGNTDWSLLLNSSINILSFDAYNYGDSLGLYINDLLSFLNRGGVIAWGIVPNDEEIIELETVQSLCDRLLKNINPLLEVGFSREDILKQSLLTSSCGLASLTPCGVEKVLASLSILSREIQDKYL
ncbi:MAG: hypothetical protein DDT42_01348 [candidate division WS2 bacterium]|uniref:Methionine synthase n=1 Tax=Psychracetigena formicireducens TaxID=2986056 RepID=A0A9E2BIH8_PSYF1|nr:hypothetical protein [Candidatus Psychracetigena formicireducens]MBT9145477.1 hypothetical protein [Candidatus Psychracetigena formicireducens]